MGKHSKKNKNAFRNNPPRGSPGILVLSETGRESKCKGEALEIIRHYFYNEKEASDPSTKGDDAEDKQESQLSLEEEIALLKKGASADAILSGTSDSTDKHKAPFRVYDTGCKGTVFVMCTIPDSELISTTISTANSVHNKGSGGIAQQKPEGLVKTPITEDCENISCLGKRKAEKEEESSLKKQKTKEKQIIKWDPIKTVQSIFQDIREQNPKAPRSRFILRMVPIQVTCFASIEEVKANATELIKDYLMPKAISSASDKGSTLPSFKIEFKRRNCDHMRRTEIVDIIANIVKDQTDRYWKEHPHEDNRDVSKPLFRVDLGNPDYTIIIEFCRTLCGMSIVANTNSYKKFNLMVLQDQCSEDVPSTNNL